MGCSSCDTKCESYERQVEADCQRIQKVAREMGYTVSLENAKQFWMITSDNWCATWLTLPQHNSRIKEYIEDYFKHYYLFEKTLQKTENTL